MDTLKQRLRDSAVSNSQLSQVVHRRWKDLDRTAKPPAPRALAVEIGELRKKGVETYWRKRPKALQALAEALELPLHQMDLPRSGSGMSFEFTRCAAVRPLLPGETPCPTGPDGTWLGAETNERLQRGFKTWSVVPHGGGKSLTCFHIRHMRDDVQVVEVPTLAALETPALRDDLHVLIRVEAPSSVDERVLGLLAGRYKASVCVLAPFAPSVARNHMSWELNSFSLASAWRETFVRWAASRMKGGMVAKAAALIDWLRIVDPAEELYRTPGDLLPLLERVHRFGAPTSKDLLESMARDAIGRFFSTHSDPFLKIRGAEVVRDMVRGRFLDLSIPVAARSVDDWTGQCAAVPQRHPPSRKARSARRTKRDPVRITEASDPALVMAAFRAEGILRVESSGDLEFAPWIRASFERELVKETIASASLEWLRWASDMSRTRQVLSAFDSLGPKERLAKYARLVAEASDALDVAAVVEVSFASSARWVSMNDPSLDAPMIEHLQEIGAAQLRLVREVGQFGCLGPVSLPCENETARKAWFDHAWRFSFVVPRPDGLESDPGLILPGWSENIDPGADEEVLALLWELDPPMRDLPRVLQKFYALRLPELIPLDLLVALALDPVQRRRLTPEHWSLLFGGKGALEAFCQRMPRASRRDAYRATFAAARGARLANLLLDMPDAMLAGWDEHVPQGDWDELLRDSDSLSVRNMLEKTALIRSGHMPTRLLRAGLRRIARDASRPFNMRADSQLPSLLEQLDVDDADLLIAIVVDHSGLGEPAAARVWALAPERAMAVAEQAVQNGSNTASPWFHKAPEGYQEPLVGVLERRSDALPEWVDLWLRMRLGHARALAPRMYELLRRSRRA